jgi:hypothetical protein
VRRGSEAGAAERAERQGTFLAILTPATALGAQEILTMDDPYIKYLLAQVTFLGVGIARAGSGKSTVGQELVVQSAKDSAVQLYSHLGGSAAVSSRDVVVETMRMVVRALGSDVNPLPDSTTELAAMYHALFSKCNSVLFLDDAASVRACPERLSALSVSHSKSGLCGAFLWVCRALNRQTRRFPARAGRAGVSADAAAVDWGPPHLPRRGDVPEESGSRVPALGGGGHSAGTHGPT